MNEDAASLDRLHDLALPPEVSWWPMAPGWYVVFGIALLIVLIVIYRAWKGWQANAYRRAALRELNTLHDATAIAELLRRTALTFAPRQVVATMTSRAWVDWLDAQIHDPMPDEVLNLLTTGVYAPPTGGSLDALRAYAVCWITQHRVDSYDIDCTKDSHR